ncbi:MAG: nucleotide-binding protein [Deferrisomatales bacterium]
MESAAEVLVEPLGGRWPSQVRPALHAVEPAARGAEAGRRGGQVWAVAGGKGGVGKSFVAANLACSLALQGRQVVLVDADLTGANLHTLFGISRPERTLNDFLKRKVEGFADVLLPTALGNLHLVCGASEFLEIANPKYAQKERLIRAIGKLGADVTLIDIGAGASLNNLDFFNLADVGLLVTTPHPTSIQNAYAFLKLAVGRRLIRLCSSQGTLKEEVAAALGGDGQARDILQVLRVARGADPQAAGAMIRALSRARARLIVNMADPGEGERVAHAMAEVTHQFLRTRLDYLGHLDFDRAVDHSIRRMQPLMLGDPSPVAGALSRIAEAVWADRDP